VVDEDLQIVVGETRFKAALKLGLEFVPVHVATGLTPAREKRIASRTTKRASWQIGISSCLPRKSATCIC
jgi:hypothetical protein